MQILIWWVWSSARDAPQRPGNFRGERYMSAMGISFMEVAALGSVLKDEPSLNMMK